MANRFVVGSNAFFSKFEDFVPHDNDVLLLEDEPKDYSFCQQIRLRGNCYFKWKRMAPKEFIEIHRDCKCGMFLGKFLVPEFVSEIGFTISDLKEISFLLEYLDERHEYERIIYESYIENDGFFLTEEQLEKAYENYKEKRKAKD